MVKLSSSALDRTFAALADPTRRQMLAQLAQGQTTVTALAAPYAMSLPAVSKHLRVLEQAGLVHREREGRTHHLRLAAAPLRDAAAWMEAYRTFWNASFDRLEALLEPPSTSEP